MYIQQRRNELDKIKTNNNYEKAKKSALDNLKMFVKTRADPGPDFASLEPTQATYNKPEPGVFNFCLSKNRVIIISKPFEMFFQLV